MDPVLNASEPADAELRRLIWRLAIAAGAGSILLIGIGVVIGAFLPPGDGLVLALVPVVLAAVALLFLR